MGCATFVHAVRSLACYVCISAFVHCIDANTGKLSHKRVIEGRDNWRTLICIARLWLAGRSPSRSIWISASDSRIDGPMGIRREILRIR